MSEYRIVKALSGFYYVETENGVVECRARGRFRKEGRSPLVGDFVTITVDANGKGTIETILPRQNAFVRPAVANVGLLVVLASCAIPETEPFLLDRILAVAARQNVPALICINKDDLASGERLRRIYAHAGYPVLCTSAVTGAGIDALRQQIAGKLAVFTGNSGVGKSSILNALSPELALSVGEVSQKLGRGRHTTRHIELFHLADGYAADTPGFSSFDSEQEAPLRKEELQYDFVDFAPYLGRCQFHDCAHLKEPCCAVRAALAAGELEQTRYDSYVRLYEIAKEHKDWELR